MGLLAKISDRLLTSPAAREDRKARLMLETHVKQLELKARRLEEGVEMANAQYIQWWDRYVDGTNLLFPSGQTTDRMNGRDWPVLMTELDLRQMRAFARLACETNAYAIGFRDHVRNFVVGTGFQWQVSLAGQKTSAVSAGQEVDPDVAACQQVLDEFRRVNGWGDDSEIRDTGRLPDWTVQPVNLERETYERTVEDGEAFVRLCEGENGIPIARAVEPELITCPPGEPQTGPWSWGIQHYHDGTSEDVRRIVAYHVADPYRPGLLGEVVPAAEMLHFKVNTKSTVKRGVSDFFPLDDEIKNAKSLLRNMVKVAGVLSAIAYIRQHAPATTSDQITTMIQNNASTLPSYAGARVPYPGQNGVDATTYLTVHQAGQIIDISNGLQYQPPPMVAGTPGFLQVSQAVLRCVGLRWGCPEYFSGDASNANFASTLVAGGPFERATQGRQQDFKLFQSHLATRVLQFAAQSGRLTYQQVARMTVKVTCPPVAIADKKGDTDRRKTMYDAKILSPQTWCAEEGYDVSQEIANWKAWRAMMPDDQAQDQGGAGLTSILGESVGHSGLVQKQITNKDGKKQTVWVKPGDDQPGGEHLPPKAKEELLSRGERAKLRVAGMLYKLDSFVPKVHAAIETIFDTPGDLQKMYHRPMGDQSFDSVRHELGISSNMLGIVLTKAVPAIIAQAVKQIKKLKTREALADGGLDQAVELLAQVVATILEEVGIKDADKWVDSKAITELLQAKMGD